MIRFLVLSFLIMGFGFPAQAQIAEEIGIDFLQTGVDGTFTCNPEEFSLIQRQTYSDDKSVFVMAGTLDMPTPGYGYSMRLDDQGFGEHKYTLVFQQPDGINPEVISPLTIEHEFVGEEDLDSIVIEFEDAPNWPDFDQIECTKVK